MSTRSASFRATAAGCGAAVPFRRMAEPCEFSLEQLTGMSRDHLAELSDSRCSLHRLVVPPFLAMRAAAAADGIDLVAFSGFRDFDRQLTIWKQREG